MHYKTPYLTWVKESPMFPMPFYQNTGFLFSGISYVSSVSPNSPYTDWPPCPTQKSTFYTFSCKTSQSPAGGNILPASGVCHFWFNKQFWNEGAYCNFLRIWKFSIPILQIRLEDLFLLFKRIQRLSGVLTDPSSQFYLNPLNPCLEEE